MLPPLVVEILAKNSEAIAGFKETQAELAKTAASAEASGARFSGAAGKMQSISKAAFLATAGAAVVVGVEAVKMAGEFQESTTKMAGQAGISADAAGKIGKAFLSAAGQTTFAAQTMVDAYSPVSKQLAAVEGHALSSSDALKVMNAASSLAEATGTDLAAATSTLAVTMQSYHIGVEGAAEASNVLFNASTLLNTPISDVSNAVDKLHGRLGVAAPSLADTASLMVDLAQHGVTGSRGLMVMQTAMSTLLGGSKTTNDTLKSLGVSVFDSSGKFIGMQAAIAKLSPALGKMTDQQKAAAETALFGASAAGTMNGVMSGGAAAFDKASAAVEKHGSVETAAEANAHTFGGQLKTLWATVKDLGVTLGTVLLPPLQATLAGFMGFFNFLKANQPVAVALGVVVGTIAVGLSSLYVITKTVQVAQAAWAVGTKLATGAQWLLNAALDANPIGIVVIALIALIGGVVLAYNKIGWFKDGVNAAWAGIKNTTAAVWNWLSTYIFPIWKLEFTLLGNAATFLWRNVLVPVWTGIQNTTATAWTWINNSVFTPFKLGITAIGTAFDQTQQFIGTAWNKIKNAAAGPARFIVEDVYNKGIVPTWNTIAGAVGLGSLSLKAQSVGFADGGVARFAGGGAGGINPGYRPGVDSIPALTSPGEAWMVPEWTRAVGADNVQRWNHLARHGGTGAVRKAMRFADGGVAHFDGGGIPDLLGSIGSFVGGAAKNVSSFIGTAFQDVAGFLKDPIGSITRLVMEPVKALAGSAGGGDFGKMAMQLPINAVTALGAKVKELLAGGGGAGTAGTNVASAGAGVQQWAPDVLRALAMVGQPSSLLQTTLRRMNQESGGNPNAINNWDSNAAMGDPSRGLMQTIGSTFAAYAMPGYNTNIYDPMSNILSSMRYAISRYGSLAAAYNQAGGYSLGGVVPVFDNGGVIPPGRSMIDNRTGAPERLSNTTRGGAGTTINNNIEVTTNATGPQIANAIGWALKTQY
ncbi:phage tail tape measure protein [Arthrobacter sp. LAPM80]|uniref:phage tail tape measure protein n=1 Tax=Arthrobacter sp. LAPM80 TaxID=3141788 RepID=UPI00398A51F3